METIVEIVGVNGDTAVIAGDRAGDKGIYLAPEVSGLLDPEVKVVSESPANFPGGRYVSHRIQARRVVFAVDILHDGSGSASGIYRDSEWRKMWAYDRPTQIKVTTRDGTRTLYAHLEEIEVDTYHDPNVLEMVRVLMTVVAYNPFWWDEEEVHEAQITGTGTHTFSVRDANPTDQLVWPIWVVTGGATWALPDYSFTEPELRNRMVYLPSLAPGEHTVVNTDPSTRQLTSATSTPVWQRMNGRRFRHPIPEWTQDVDFTVAREGTGTGTVQLRLRRPFSRPWGLR